MTPRRDATLYRFPVSAEARLRLVMRNLEAVLEEQRAAIEGMRDAFTVVGETRAEPADPAQPRRRDHAAPT